MYLYNQAPLPCFTGILQSLICKEQEELRCWSFPAAPLCCCHFWAGFGAGAALSRAHTDNSILPSSCCHSIPLLCCWLFQFLFPAGPGASLPTCCPGCSVTAAGSRDRMAAGPGPGWHCLRSCQQPAGLSPARALHCRSHNCLSST